MNRDTNVGAESVPGGSDADILSATVAKTLPLARKARWRGLAALTLALTLSACTTDSKLREADLDRLRSWYPGSYSNVAQVEKDMADGVADVREPVDILIIHVAAMAIGDTVFYVQQSDAMNPQRILSQRVHRFEKGPDDLTLIQTILTLKQPERWKGGEMQPDLFKGIRPDDVQAGPGCALAWTFDGTKFTANCPVAPTSTGDSQLRVELTIDELRLAELSFNGRVRPVPSRSADPLYRFERK
jgi:hypothetical protein